MAHEATQRTTINAPAERCFAAVADFEGYPEWAREVQRAEVVEREDGGRASIVAFQTAAFGRKTNYTLRYEYDEPDRISWTLVRGDLMRRLDGCYEFAPSVDRDDETDVTYHLELDLVAPLPGFLNRRAAPKLLRAAPRDLKAHREARAP